MKTSMNKVPNNKKRRLIHFMITSVVLKDLGRREIDIADAMESSANINEIQFLGKDSATRTSPPGAAADFKYIGLACPA
jgi:hypothetical protein